MFILRASWKINYYMYLFMYVLNVVLTPKYKCVPYLLKVLLNSLQLLMYVFFHICWFACKLSNC